MKQNLTVVYTPIETANSCEDETLNNEASRSQSKGASEAGFENETNQVKLHTVSLGSFVACIYLIVFSLLQKSNNTENVVQKVSVKVGLRTFVGIGVTPQAARHNAAARYSSIDLVIVKVLMSINFPEHWIF